MLPIPLTNKDIPIMSRLVSVRARLKHILLKHNPTILEKDKIAAYQLLRRDAKHSNNGKETDSQYQCTSDDKGLFL